MKRITKKRLADQRAAVNLALDIPLPDEVAKQLLDISAMLAELDAVIDEKDKFKAATDTMLALGILNAKQAKQGLESAANYR